MKKDILSWLKKHTSTLLCIASAGGLVMTAVLAAKSTPKAMDILKKRQSDKGEELTPIEKARAVFPCYVPAVVAGAASIACIFCANVLNKKQQASLVGAYALLNNQYRRYTDKVKDICGEDTHKAVLNAIAVEQADDTPVNAYAITGRLSSFEDDDEERRLFYDAYSQRYFESTVSHVLQAEYHVNRNYSLGSDVTLNDFYLFLGIDKVNGGDDIGWSWSNYELPWIDFENAPMRLEDGTPYHMIVMIFAPEPMECED